VFLSSADRGLPWLCRAAVLTAIVGVLGTWRSSGQVSLDGLEGPHDGWLVTLFTLIALAGSGLRSWPAIVLVLGCGAAVVYFALRNLLDDRTTLGGSAGWGIWLTIAAGVVLAAVAVLAASERRRR
jgi:hypothetical protein